MHDMVIKIIWAGRKDTWGRKMEATGMSIECLFI